MISTNNRTNELISFTFQLLFGVTIAECRTITVLVFFKLKLKLDKAVICDYSLVKMSKHFERTSFFSKTLKFMLFYRCEHEGGGGVHPVILTDVAERVKCNFIFRYGAEEFAADLCQSHADEGYSTVFQQCCRAHIFTPRTRTECRLLSSRAVGLKKYPPCHSWFMFYPHQLNNLT